MTPRISQTMTREEALRQYAGLRNLKITTDQAGNITEISYTAPCLMCGKYHRTKKNGFSPASKAGKRCEMRVLGMAHTILMEKEA